MSSRGGAGEVRVSLGSRDWRGGDGRGLFLAKVGGERNILRRFGIICGDFSLAVFRNRLGGEGFAVAADGALGDLAGEDHQRAGVVACAISARCQEYRSYETSEQAVRHKTALSKMHFSSSVRDLIERQRFAQPLCE